MTLFFCISKFCESNMSSHAQILNSNSKFCDNSLFCENRTLYYMGAFLLFSSPSSGLDVVCYAMQTTIAN